MKIAFTTKGTEWGSEMDPRFGRSEFILVYDDESKNFKHFDNQEIANQAHGAGPQNAQKLTEKKADILITGNGPGGNAATILKKTGVKIFVGAGEMTVKQAFEEFKKDSLPPF